MSGKIFAITDIERAFRDGIAVGIAVGNGSYNGKSEVWMDESIDRAADFLESEGGDWMNTARHIGGAVWLDDSDDDDNWECSMGAGGWIN